MDVVPNITNCPIPVLIPCRTHQSCWKRYCCRTEHTDVSGTGSTGGVYIGREDNGRRVKTPFPYPSIGPSTPAMSNRLRCCRCRCCSETRTCPPCASGRQTRSKYHRHAFCSRLDVNNLWRRRWRTSTVPSSAVVTAANQPIMGGCACCS